MRMTLLFSVLLALAAVSSVSAHIMVPPPQWRTGATQKYEVRMHNEGE